MFKAQCISLHGKIYVGGGHSTSDDLYKLFTSTDLKSWSVFKTPTKYYALTTYHSQVVLIGGVEQNHSYATNKVWAGVEGIKSLPPMRTSRHSSSAINTQSKHECIVVAGGVEKLDIRLNTVEVFVQEEWSFVQPLPCQCCSIKCNIHDGILYLMGGYGQDNSVFYCKLDSLLSSLQSNDALWKTSQVPLYCSSCVTFHHNLVSVGGDSPSKMYSSSDIHAYSPFTRSWLHVEDLPTRLDSTTSTVISTGELVVIGGRSTMLSLSCKVFKASLKGDY